MSSKCSVPGLKSCNWRWKDKFSSERNKSNKNIAAKTWFFIFQTSFTRIIYPQNSLFEIPWSRFYVKVMFKMWMPSYTTKGLYIYISWSYLQCHKEHCSRPFVRALIVTYVTLNVTFCQLGDFLWHFCWPERKIEEILKISLWSSYVFNAIVVYFCIVWNFCSNKRFLQYKILIFRCSLFILLCWVWWIIDKI